MGLFIEKLRKVKSDEKNIQLSHVMFYIYMCSMIVVKGLGFYDNTNIYRVVLLLGCLLVGIKILLDKHSALELCAIIVLLCFGIMSWRIAGNQGALMTIVMIISVKGMDLRQVFRTASIFWLLTFMIQVISQLLWLRPRDYVIHSKFGLGYIIRWALGYAHPNVLQIMYTVIVIGFFIAFAPNGKRFIKWTVCSALGAAYIFMYSLSVTGILFFVAFIILAYYFRFRQGDELVECKKDNRITGTKSITKVEEYIIYLLIPIAIFVSVCGPVLFKGKLFDIADSFFNSRFFLSRYFLTEYSQSLFGRDFSYLYHIYTMDCSFVNLLMNGGVLIFASVILLYILAIIELVRNYKQRTDDLAWIKLACILSVCFAGMSEPFLFNNSFKNISLFIVGDSMYKFLNRHGKVVWNGKEIYLAHKCMITGNIRQRLSYAYQEYKKLIMTTALVVGIAGAIITASTVRLPEKVYARQWNCNAEDHESLYLTPDEANTLMDDENVWFLDYKDVTDPIQVFDGSTITIEYYRDIISAFVIIGLISGIIAVLVISIISKKDSIQEG